MDAEQREIQAQQKKLTEDLEDCSKDTWDKVRKQTDEVFEKSSTAHQLVLNTEVLAGLGKVIHSKKKKKNIYLFK